MCEAHLKTAETNQLLSTSLSLLVTTFGGHSRKTIFDGYHSTANSNDSQNGYALSNLLKLRWFDLPKRMIGTVRGVALFKVNSFERSTSHDITASLNLMSQTYSVRPINAPQKYT